MPIEVRSPEQRFRTDADGRTTFHAFSFGAHYDPHNIGFGALVALNDERLAPGAGYPDHPHRDAEILTWVLRGSLLHRDSIGTDRVVLAGQVARLSAGAGVTHSEIAGSDGAWFLQSWVRPDESDLVPAYDVRDLPALDGATDWVRLASDVDAPRLAARGVVAYAARLAPGHVVAVPDALRLHLYVVDGEVAVGERVLDAGSAARMVDEGGRRVAATDHPALVLAWALP